MVKKIFSITFIISGLALIALGFPLFAGKIEPNTLIGFAGDVPLSDSEWMAYNRVNGAGTLTFGFILLFYHIIALVKMKSVGTSSYVLRGFAALIMSTIPAFLVMYIVETTL
ncbi:MAG: hypothetical protein HWD92_05595 [Flavobacteriia bacterium]|nr:hypothetical protein [Flavobacteriia bacterium]